MAIFEACVCLHQLQLIQTECSSVCNWQYEGGTFTLSITFAIDDLAAPPDFESWSVVVQITLLDVSQPKNYSFGMPPIVGNLTSATGNSLRCCASVQQLFYILRTISFKLLQKFSPTTGWNVEINVVPTPVLHSVSGNSSLIQSQSPGLPGPPNAWILHLCFYLLVAHPVEELKDSSSYHSHSYRAE
jgi:hypothetical protein